MDTDAAGTSRIARSGGAVALAIALLLTLVVGASPGRSDAAEALFDVPPAAAGVPSIHDGDPATTERLLKGEPTAASVEVSQQRFDAAGAAGRRATGAVLARDDDFADALAGSGLLADAPLLLTDRERLDDRVGAELDRVLADGATVHLLGGPNALSSAVEQAVRDRGFRTVRLAGPSRIETAVAVAKEVHRRSGSDVVMVARAFGVDGNPTAAWADSVAAGGLAATLGVPLVVTPSDRMHGEVKKLLAGLKPSRTVLLGGTVALSDAVAQAAPNPVRVSGRDRTATAVALAEQAWGAPTTGERSFVVVNGYRTDGWAYGLVAAGLSADARSPILLVGDEVGEHVRRVVRTCGEPQVDVAAIGDGAQVTASVRERLDTLDGDSCGPGGTLLTASRLEGFTGCDDALAYYQELALERVGPYGLDGGFEVLPVDAPAEEGAAGDDSGGAPGSPTQDRDVSDTNVQEEGVDEPDLIETDGDRAFVVARGTVQAIDLTGPTPRVASTLDLPDGSHELVLHRDRLLVLTRSFGAFGPMPVEPMPERTASSDIAFGISRVVLTSFDVSDVDAPRRVASTEIEGDLRAARSIDGTARIVVQSYPGDLPWSFPEDGSDEAHERAAEANRDVIRRSTLDDWTVTYTTRDADGATVRDGRLVDCNDLRVPPRPSDLGTVTVATVDVHGDLVPTSSAAVTASSDTVYASKDRLVVATQRWVGWRPESGDTGGTELHTFDISDPDATRYVASGEVAGFLLNQFSMSDHAGHLRVATTEGVPWGDQPTSSSTVTVLREAGGTLTQVGRVGGLGEGERIFAVRFLGDLAAVVTFRQVDPLYLLDLSDPARPRVTGELKIPGFSSYLQRISDDLLIGIGQDADSEGRTLGTQVATYDISDRAAPTQVDKVVFPNGWSAAEHDHRALLHWAPAGLVVLPLDQWSETGSGFHGAVALRLDAAGDLREAARLTHRPEGEWFPSVTRAFVVDDGLFTTSDAGLRQDSLSTLRERSWTRFR